MKAVFLFLLVANLLCQELSPPFSFEKMKDLIEQEGVDSVEKLLKLLPQEVRSNYVLMHSSNSRFPSSPQYPRAILHSADAKFKIAINGDPASPSYKKVELSFWNEKDKSFDQREISFETKPIHYSGKNPGLCKRCHGEDNHDLFNAYNEWPGMIGSQDDVPTGPEKAYLDYFVGTYKDHPYYQNLLGVEELLPKSSLPHTRLKGDPGRRFVAALSRLNSERIIKKLKRDPEFEKMKYLYLYLNGQCYCKPNPTIESYSEVVDNLARHVIQNLTKFNPNSTECKNSGKHYAALPFIQEILRRRGLDASGWSMNPEGQAAPHKFKNGVGINPVFMAQFIKEFEDELQASVAVSSDQSRALGVPKAFPKDTDQFCSAIKERAFLALADVPSTYKEIKKAARQARRRKKNKASCSAKTQQQSFAVKIDRLFAPIKRVLARKRTKFEKQEFSKWDPMKQVNLASYKQIEENSQTQWVEIDASIHQEEDFSPSPNNKILLVKDNNGKLKYYRRPMRTTVCLDGLCNLAEFDLIFDKNGNFLSYALNRPTEKAKWKVDHAQYSENDFAQLQKLIYREMRNSSSPLNEKPQVDVLTGATVKPLARGVQGSAYTQHEMYLRSIETQRIIEDQF